MVSYREAVTNVPPYVGMARKQNGGSISVQTPIVHYVVNSTHPKTVSYICSLALPQHYSGTKIAPLLAMVIHDVVIRRNSIYCT